MAGKESGPESKPGYRVAAFIEKKSFWIGGGALLVGLLVPPLALVAIDVAAWEGIQIVGAEAYKSHVKAKEMKANKEYRIAA